MRTNVTSSTLASYDALKAKGMAESQALILAYMRHDRIYTRKQIARGLGMETSSVSGRVNELIESEQIEVCGHIKCPISNRMVEAIKLASEQKALF